MKIERYKICLSDITQGGLNCRNPQIRWESLGDLEISCPDNNCNCVEIQVPEDSAERCFNVIIDCEDCDKCPPQVIKRCLCNSNSDCGECEICDPRGFCVSRCVNGQVCKDDVCVDCRDANDCPDGKVCVGGKCVCPPDKIYLLPYDDCGQCLNDSHCPACTRCVDGKCLPIDCGTGVCDPDTNDCAECVGTGDCTGVNQCCVSGKCTCCDGFVFNPRTGICDPEGDCRRDDDCPVCTVCVGGSCVPKVCPEGYICIDDECRKECDCAAGPCSRTEACIRYNSTTCYCKDCKGSCNSGIDCEYGCFCDNGQCRPNPCANTTCADSLDCGEGCGCFNSLCVPCSTFECNSSNPLCAQVDGCLCQGPGCVGDPCSDRPCENGADCGVGCGCFNGVCASCEKLSCLGLDCRDALGCECIGNNCRDITSCSGGCFVASDCGEGCTCYQGECTPCGDFPCDDCNDRDGCECLNSTCDGADNSCEEWSTLSITKNDDNCTITGTMINDQCCACDPIEWILEQNVKAVPAVPAGGNPPGPGSQSTAEITFTLSFFKNGVKLSDLDIENEDDYLGQFRLKVNFANKLPIIKVVNVDYNSSTPDTIVFEKFNLPAGYTGYDAVVEMTEDMRFFNECIYKKVLFAQFTDPKKTTVVQGVLKSDSCRSPLFTWYRSAFPGFTEQNIIVRKYVSKIPPVPNDPISAYTYRDTLEYDDARGGLFYRLDADCACGNKTVTYGTCTNPSRLLFCKPPTISPVFSNCNQRLTFPTAVRTCAANAYRDTVIPIPGNPNNVVPGVIWELLVETVAVPAYNSNPITEFRAELNTLNGGQVLLIPANTQLNFNSPVTRVKWRIKNDPCKDCEYEFDVTTDPQCCQNPPTMTISANCATNGFNVLILDELNQPMNKCSVCLYMTEDTQMPIICNATNTQGLALFPNTPNGSYWVGLPWGSPCDPYGCIEREQFVVNCLDCPTKSVSALYNPNNQILTINLSSIELTNNYAYFVNGNPFTNGTPIALPNGTHELRVVEQYPGGETCEYVNPNFPVNNCGVTVIIANYIWDIFTEELQITSILGGTAPYSVTFNGVTYNGVGNGGINISTVGVPDGIRVLTITDSNGCLAQFNVNIDRCSIFEGNAVYSCVTNAMDLTFNNGIAPYTYEVKDSNNITITSGVTNLNTVNYVPPVPLPNGVYTLFVIDGNSCVDDDPFEISCSCNPAPTFDVRGISPVNTGGTNWDVTVTLQSLTNLTAPLTVDVFAGSGCTTPLATPYQQVINNPVPIFPIVGPFQFDSAIDGVSGSIRITDANGCVVCRNISIIA